MKKNILLLIIVLAITGCNATINQYASVYNNAINKGQNVKIIKEGDFEYVKNIVFESCEKQGYSNVIYSNPSQGFLIITKKTSISKSLLVGKPTSSWQIMLKFTKVEQGKTRIDLVRSSNVAITNKEVDSDIEKIAEAIRNK